MEQIESMRIVFCTPFHVESLRKEISLVNPSRIDHPYPWITLLIQSLSSQSGVELHIVTLSSNIRRDYTLKNDGITYHILRSHGIRAKEFFKPFSNGPLPYHKQLDKLEKRIKSIRPDIVHGHGTGIYSLAAVQSGITHVVSLQGLMGDIAKVAPTKHYKKARDIEHRILNQAKVINTKTKLTANAIGFKYPGRKLFSIEDPINESFWQNALPTLSNNLFYVARIEKYKGVEEWIQAFSILLKNFRKLKGYVIGWGPRSYLGRPLAQVLHLGLTENIQFTGQLSAVEISDLFSQGGVFCLPSHVDHCPNAVMEAMASGLPVVSTGVGDLMNIVENESSGIIIEKSDPDLIVKAVGRILSADAVHDSFGRKGREIATKRWLPSFIANKHLKMYEEILQAI